MRLVFAGTPEAAVPSLRRLAASEHEIVEVVTRTDAPIGRRRVLTPSPVAAAATELGLPVRKTDRLDDDATTGITAHRPDLGVIVAYGGLVREPLLSAPTRGWINLHFSLLPRWRGAAPVAHAMFAGERITGAGVFQLVPELDAGPIFGETEYEIPDDATAGSVLDALADRGADLLADVVDAIADGNAASRPQTGAPTFAPKLTVDDGRIDWTQSARTVRDRIRGATPEPGAFTTIAAARLKVLETRDGRDAALPHPLAPGALSAPGKRLWIGTGDDPVELITVQPAGKGPMRAADWRRGLRDENPAADA